MITEIIEAEKGRIAKKCVAVLFLDCRSSIDSQVEWIIRQAIIFGAFVPDTYEPDENKYLVSFPDHGQMLVTKNVIIFLIQQRRVNHYD